MFDLQEEGKRLFITMEYVKVEILGDRKAPLVKRMTGNLETYNLYLQGRFFWNKRGKENLPKSVDDFNKALAVDPKYALAYAGLADAYGILGDNMLLPPNEAYPKAKEFAEKAIGIDTKLAEAYSCLACIKQEYEWDFSGAEREFKRAIEISPGDANAHHWYAFLLSYIGRHDEAITEIKLARDLDPLAPRIRANVGHVLYKAKRYNAALEELKKAIEFDPTHAATYEYIGEVYRELGRYKESIASFGTAKKLENRPVFSIKLAVTYARAGQTAESRKTLDELKERSKKEYVSLVFLAAAYASLGERDNAFDLLDKAYTGRDSRLVPLKIDPI
jgi:Tfp pilus assembly protein PilF